MFRGAVKLEKGWKLSRLLEVRSFFGTSRSGTS